MAEAKLLTRTSERATWRRCRQKWWWAYVGQREPIIRKGALSFGTMVHRALEVYYPPGIKRGPHPAGTFADIYDAEPDVFEQWDEEGNRYPARDLGVAMLNGYVEKYGADPDWEIIQSEMTFRVDVHLKTGEFLGTYVGKFDGVARNRHTGRVVLLEHKTAKAIKFVRINSGYGEQGLSYWWGATLWLRSLGLMGKDEYLNAVVFNWLKKGMPDDRPRNADGHALNKPKKPALIDACRFHDLPWAGAKVETLEATLRAAGIDPGQFGEVSKNQGLPLFERQEMLLGRNALSVFQRRMRMEMYEMRQARKGEVLIYKSPTKDCDWDCQFVNVCELHEMGADYESLFEFEFKEWDPYSDHEIEAEKGTERAS